MKTGRGRRFPTHMCPMHGCVHVIPRSHIACSAHWAMVPKWLQLKITEQLHYGIAWKCHPTQEYLDLRSQAVKIVNHASSERYAKPTGAQIPLFSHPKST